VERLPGKRETMSSNPSTAKKSKSGNINTFCALLKKLESKLQHKLLIKINVEFNELENKRQ
jgi:hypothetical protein